MMLNKKELFEYMKSLWPTKINLNGMVINGKKTKGLQILNEIYNMHEESFDVNDHWNQLAMWAFHQALWKLSQEQLESKLSFAYPGSVTFEAFDQHMQENLLGNDCWAVERKIYFEDAQSGSNGLKVDPTPEELKGLNELTNDD